MNEHPVSGEVVMGVEWMMFVWAYLMVAMRIGIRLARQQQKHVIVSDVFLIISALMCLGLIICDTLTYTMGVMSKERSLAKEVTADTIAEQVTLKQISFASNYFYDTGLYFPKATILALYFELFPATMPKLRGILFIVIAFTIASGITTFLLDTFYCPHVPDNWSLEEGSCSVFNSLLVLQVDWALNFSSDIFIFVLPFPLLRALELRRQQRYGLFLTFGLGILTIFVNLIRFVRIQTGTDWNRVYMWSMSELSMAIIVVSMPALKYLLRYWKLSPSSRSKSGSSSYYTSGLSTGPHGNRRQNQISCSLADESGSQVELNRFTRGDVIFKTKEVRVDSSLADSENRVSDEGRWTRKAAGSV